MLTPRPIKRPTICVFCGSSHGASPIYAELARRFGTGMVERGFDLVFGGGGVGLMGEVARAASLAGGHVTGIIPNFLRHVEPPLKISTEIIFTETMNERKARMFELSDAFVVLPGGIGTLDEFSEAHTAAQLNLHKKPIVVVNVNGYYGPLLALIDQYVSHGFADARVKTLYQVAPTVEHALEILAAHFATAAHAGARSR
jgi:uncharacterized protein (TIGR00730 family)